MWFLCLFLFLGSVLAKNITVENDLQIVGSDNHFQYQPTFRSYDIPQEAGFYQTPADGLPPQNFDDKQEAPIMNYPVKTVQRFKDQDGNIRVVTSYSNRDDNPLPIYKERGVGKHNKINQQFVHLETKPLQASATAASHTPTVHSSPEIIEPRNRKVTGYSETRFEPKRGPKKMEYSASKSVTFPNNEGELVANEHETSVKDGSSSSYNHHSSYNQKSKKPTVKISNSDKSIPTHSVGKIVNQPLQVAGSSYVSDIDDGFVDDGGYDGGGVEHSDYGGGGTYSHGGAHHGGGGGGGGGGHGGGFAKEKGKSYAHGEEESKGDKGEKGHKKKESYEKGHSEKHGHEEHKGGKKEESGEKTGHHDEANAYDKGHTSSNGKKAQEKGHSKGHKKGHKTKGFRTVHHKDEYKKDEVFYDEDHDAGYQKGHGHDEHSHQHAKGGNAKKGHLQSGYKDAHKGYRGDKAGGQSFEHSKGYNGNEGHQAHHGHHSHYAQGKGHAEGESHGQGGKGHY